MAAPLYVYKVICSKLCPRFSHKLCGPYLAFLSVSSITRLLALLESTAEAPHRQVTKQANRPFLIIVSFSQATTILTDSEAITNAEKWYLFRGVAPIP